MRDQEALELIDAHLDDDQLTDEQIGALAVWLRENPHHAQGAFRRMFLHSFLRRRLQAQQLPLRSPSTELAVRDPADVDPPGELLVVPGPAGPRAPLAPADPAVAVRERPPRRPRRGLVAGAVVLLGAAVAWFSLMPPGLWSQPMAEAYDGFDYPATSIPAPAIDAQTWPTKGGLQGLAGGNGWAEPWQETGNKVGVVIDHARETDWDPRDMRRFKPLGHTDADGRVLRTTGLQMRTAIGPRSMTARKLNLMAFPESMRDELGLGRDGMVVWFSFLAQSFDGTAENSRFTYLQLGSRGVSGFRVGKMSAASSGNWGAMGLLNGAQVNLRSSAVPSGEMAFLVVRLEFRPGPENAAVWINPGLGSEPRLAEATLQLSVPDFRFDGVSVNANYSTDIDEIRLGQSFRAVAPIE